MELDVKWVCDRLNRIEAKLDLILVKEQPKDRQDKEKAIKDSLKEPDWDNVKEVGSF